MSDRQDARSAATTAPRLLDLIFFGETTRAMWDRWTRQRKCVHEWEYDAEESKGPWTGYIERCSLCGALQQVPQ